MLICWGERENVAHKHFECYSTEPDLLLDRNRWNAFNFDDDGVGFPRDSHENTLKGGEWAAIPEHPHYRSERNFAFYICRDWAAMAIRAEALREEEARRIEKERIREEERRIEEERHAEQRRIEDEERRIREEEDRRRREEERYRHPDCLFVGDEMRPDDELRSRSGEFTLKMQGDHNLVVYRGGQALWDSGQKGGRYMVLQEDGNFVQYRNDGRNDPSWASGSNDKPVDFAIMQDDGNFVLYNGRPDGEKKPIWATGTDGGKDVRHKNGGGTHFPWEAVGKGLLAAAEVVVVAAETAEKVDEADREYEREQRERNREYEREQRERNREQREWDRAKQQGGEVDFEFTDNRGDRVDVDVQWN